MDFTKRNIFVSPLIAPMRNLIILLISLYVTDVFSQADIRVAEPSDWITPASIPEESEVSKYDVKSGVYFKLIDYQVDVDASEYYSHYVYNVLTNGGVSNISQFQIDYDSSYQKVIFHQFRIHRRGEVIDRTNDISFEYIKNEQQLESNIYTGDVTALAVLPDVRKGDWVEASYTVVGSNPVFDDNRYYLIPVNDVNPIDRVYVKLRTEESAYYEHTVSDDTFEAKETIANGKRMLVIDRNNLEACQIEETMPPWIIPYEFIEITNTRSWEQVNRWALKLFENKADDQVDMVFDEIFYPEYTQEDKLNAIINFVQDEIRYMGIETGIGSIEPFAPNQVIEQRFGDCKDKALLMSVMMRKIGVEAYPVLVNSVLVGKIADMLPSAYMFDHVILRYTYKGKDYWIDPTFSYQGGDFQTVRVFDYEKGLVIKEGSTDLAVMDVEDKVSGTDLIERFDVSSYEEPGKLIVETIQRGTRADQTRQILEYYSLKELAEYYKYFYARLFPTVEENEKIKVKDKEEENVMTTTENYLVPGIWKENQEGYEGKWVLNYQPVSLYSYIASISCEKKEYPVYYMYPADYYQETYIDFAEEISFDDESRTYDNVAFSFTKTAKLLSPKKAMLTYTFKSKTKEISPEDFGQVCREIDEITESLPIVFYFSKKDTSNQQLGFKFRKVSLKEKPIGVTNPDFYIKKVVNDSKSKNGWIGLVDVKSSSNLTIAMLENGIEGELENFLGSQQVVADAAVPLELSVRQLQVSEKNHDQPEKTALLEFQYVVSYKREGKRYEFEFVDNIESSGTDVSSLHEQNIRMSLEQLIGSINPEAFKKARKK